jgi:hypothetical protein
LKNFVQELKKGFLPFGNVNLLMNVSDFIVLLQYWMGSLSVCESIIIPLKGPFSGFSVCMEMDVETMQSGLLHVI